MKNSKLNSQEAVLIVPESTDKRKAFETVKRTFETALASGQDYTAPLYDLATAVAYSVINKCLDPQRKTAAERETVSNNGYNPALLDVKRGIAFDRRLLDNTAAAAEKATRIAHNANGDLVTEVADKDAENVFASVIGKTLSDGIDLVQSAIVALLEQAAEHADPAIPWLDTPYNVSRLSRRVYIKREDNAAYRDETTTPIQEAYRAVRRLVQDSRAMQTDPRNGYTYIEDLTTDGLNAIYYRLHKWADLGGYDCDGHYTTDQQTVTDYATIIARLELTPRQRSVLEMRIQGKGYKAIATYLGVTQRAIAKTVAQIQEKAVAIGIAPTGYTAAQD